MMITAVSSEGNLVSPFDGDTTDASKATDTNLHVSSNLVPLSQLNLLEHNVQTTVTDPVGAASDACMGTCKAVGAVTGGLIGFAAGNGPGAVAGVGIGYTVGDIVGEFICDPKFVNTEPTDLGRVSSERPDAGVSDTQSTPGADTVGGDAVGGYSLGNGGVESNAGATGDGNDVSVDTSTTNSSTSPGTDNDGPGANGTDESNSSSSTDSTQDPSAGQVGASNGSGDLPPDDAGGDTPADPRRPFFNPSLATSTSLANLTIALGESGLSSVGMLGLTLRA